MEGFSVKIFGKSYSVKYPKKLYASLDETVKKVLAENFIYCRTKSLSLQTDQTLNFNSAKPLVKDLVSYGIIKDIPRLAYVGKIDSEKLFEIFDQNKDNDHFLDQKFLTTEWISKNKFIIALSFGKDSLLSYALVKELNLDFKLVYVKEMEDLNGKEENFKKEIILDFSKNEGVEIDFLTENVDQMFFDLKFEREVPDLENTNGMLAFSLELLPFSNYYQAKYLVFGNEANFTDYYDDGKNKIYPSFDQSVEYAKQENQTLNELTNNSVQVVSLVEPIYNIVEMAILVNRYPEFLKYLMSCSPQEGDSDRWCYRCPMCAKAFIYLVAVGGQAEQIGFNRDFFKLEYKDLYPLFSENIKRVYEKPPAVRDEQLLSFLLAYRRGLKGDLIDLFKKDYLAEAEIREAELKKKFLSINDVVTIPDFIKNQLINIYQEEITKI